MQRAARRKCGAAWHVRGRACSVSPVFCFGTWYTTMLSFTRTRLPIGNAAPADCAADVTAARRAACLAPRARGCAAPASDTAASISARAPLQAARYAARSAVASCPSLRAWQKKRYSRSPHAALRAPRPRATSGSCAAPSRVRRSRCPSLRRFAVRRDTLLFAACPPPRSPPRTSHADARALRCCVQSMQGCARWRAAPALGRA